MLSQGRGPLALTIFALAHSGWASTDYVGSQACAACHRAQANSQNSSAHAAALFRTPNHPLATAFRTDRRLLRAPGYQFSFSSEAGALHTRIVNAADVMDLPMEWAFGAGRQAVTFVTRVDRDWYVEHYASWYPALGSWAATPGQNALRPRSLMEAAGVLYKIADPAAGIAGCFACHSTGPISFNARGEVTVGETGVHCEACHGPGAAHAVEPDRIGIPNPGTLTAVQLNEFCGRCHRSPAGSGVTTDWNNSWNVRHQPVYLTESACFRKSGGRLSCLTCHGPHETGVDKPAAFYNGLCIGCHSAGAALREKAVCLERMPSNCIDCHMPRVSPQPGLRFTNHWIGIYKDGAKLKPLRARK